MSEAAYSKKTVTLRVNGIDLELVTAHGLFSSHSVDAGSRLLLRSLTTAAEPGAILDLGCGYGPLGLGMKARFPDAQVDLVDRDALAVRFAELNARRSGLLDTRAYGSLGYDGIPSSREFDLIVSNIPGKAGPPVIEHLLLGATRVLMPHGIMAVVVVSSLATAVVDHLEGGGAEIIERLERNSHTVLHYRPGPGRSMHVESAFAGGTYRRGSRTYSRAGLSWLAETSWGLAEFDSLGYATALVIDLIVNNQQAARRVLVVNPGQGHIPSAIVAACSPTSMTLSGRDLLSLQTSRLNLEGNGFNPAALNIDHSVDPSDGPFDLVVASLPPKLPTDIIAMTIAALDTSTAPGGTLVLGGRSTTVTRSLDSPELASYGLRERVRSHGFSAARMRK